jgi:hypothetical protein
MAKTYDIPIVARGRIIPPGDDAVEFGGRAGASFRCPDPRRHIADLVLTNTDRMRDLQDLPTRDILDFLAALGPRLTLDNPYLREAFELSLQAGGLTEPVLRAVYESLPAMFDRAYLEETAERTIGIDYLDGWVAQGGDPQSPVRVRAVGTRILHITAGNVPIVGALTVIQSALTKGDCLIKLPSNDPLSANAIARTMINLDPDHPVVKHVAVAYWKGGDEAVESQICRTSRIDKITAWGGMASMKHIQKYLVPGLDFVALNPKLSISLVGREALESRPAMEEAAYGVALLAGRVNQSACSNTRVVYVESDTDDASLARVIELGDAVYEAFQRLPPELSTAAAEPNPELEDELNALALEEELYWVRGDTVRGGVVVSRFSDRIDCYDKLSNRVVNLVPMPDIQKVLRWCDDTTQTVGVYPDRLLRAMRDRLALAGVQRIVPLKGVVPADAGDRGSFPGMPHDGIEPMRRMVRWVVDESGVAADQSLAQAAE